MIHEYRAVAYVDRYERSEVFVFLIPARCVIVGESIYIRESGLFGWRFERTAPRKGWAAKIKKIERDERWRVLRFKIRTGWLWAEWTPWILDEDEVFIDAEDNPYYDRGSRRHWDDD